MVAVRGGHGKGVGVVGPQAQVAKRERHAPVLVADNRKAREVLGWTPKLDLEAIVESAWAWHSREA